MKIKFSFLGLLIAALVICTGLSAEAAPVGTDWNTQKITVIGTGVPPAGAYGAQARIMARRAAQADAYRQLAEVVKGVQVDANTTVEMAMVQSDTVTLRVDAVIRGAKIVAENVTSDGAYEVTMELPMFGASGGLAETVLERPTYVEPFPEPQTQRIETNINISIHGGYTGLIIDCRGFRLNPVMSPVIKNDQGQPIYGFKNLDYDKVITYGMAGYTQDPNNVARAGAHPLVVKAVSLENHNGYPVISTADANKALIENGATHFLDATCVVFIR